MAGLTSAQNGKLGGRPKGTNAIAAEKARSYISDRVSAELEPLIDIAIKQALEGDLNARKDLLDRAYGKPKESVEIEVQGNLKVDF